MRIFISINPYSNAGLRHSDRINVFHAAEIDFHYQE